MDLKEIKRLIGMVEEANISHLKVEDSGLVIEINKHPKGGAVAASPAVQHVYSDVPAPAVTAPAPAQAPVETEAPAENDANLVPIKAQMVGTFYASSSPEAAPYVKVGDTISSGQVICILEAMKLFNEIESEIDGTIEKVCVSNGDVIEYGQDLFLVRV